MNIAAGLLVVLILGYVIKVVLSGHRFNLRSAMQPAETFKGEAIGRMLAVVTIIVTVVDTTVIPATYVAVGGYHAPGGVADGGGQRLWSRMTRSSTPQMRVFVLYYSRRS